MTLEQIPVSENRDDMPNTVNSESDRQPIARKITQTASVVRDSKALPWKPVRPENRPRPV